MKAPTEHKGRLCSECLAVAVVVCDGRKPAQEIAPPSNDRPAIVVPAHACKVLLCPEHANDDGDERHLCSTCVFA